MTTSTAKPFSSWKIILSLVLLLLVTQLTIFGVISLSVNKVNDEAKKKAEGYVESVVEDKLNQLAVLTKDYAYWDDTIQHAYLSPSPEWIEENIGQYLTDTFHISDLLIINDQGNAVLSLRNGQSEEANFSHFDRPGLDKLISQARLSGPIPVPVSGIILINNTPAITGAAVLTPEDGSTLPSPRPVLVLARRLEPAYLHTLSQQYRLAELQFSHGKTINKDKVFIGIKNPLNESLGRLYWNAEKPGNLVLGEIRIPLFSLFVISIFITIYVINIFHTTSRNLKKAYEDLAHNANHDFLTGLANRRLFDEILEQTVLAAKRDNKACALLHLDLDDFKTVNDTYGHQAGDQLLVCIAERLKESIRQSDFVARIGGDEFFVILRNTGNNQDLKNTVEKILFNLKQPVKVSGIEFKITASVGISIIPDDGADPETLMKNADIALYRSKDKGRNTLQFYKE